MGFRTILLRFGLDPLADTFNRAFAYDLAVRFACGLTLRFAYDLIVPFAYDLTVRFRL